MEQTVTTELTLEDRIANRQRLIAMKAEIEKQLEEEKAAILAEYAERDIEAFPIDETHDLVLSVRSRSTLDKTELISQGVTTEQIKKATKQGKDYFQLDPRERK